MWPIFRQIQRDIEETVGSVCFELDQLTAHTDKLFTPEYVRQDQMPEPDGYRTSSNYFIKTSR